MSSKRKFEDHPTSVDSSSLKKPLIENKTIVDDAEKTKTSIRSDKKDDIVKKVPTRPVSTTPPPLLSKANDAISISKSNKLAAVTALAIATTSKDDCPVLYSGHANGKICKWSLATNTIAWERQIFADMSEGILSKDNTPDVGIRGISINENSLGEQLIYTWSHTSESGDRSKPNKVQILRGLDGMPTQELRCDIDEMEIQPLISCVVFTKLNYNDVWEDSAIVGLQASAEVLDHDSRFTDFDLDEVEDFAYGNILPFVGEDIEETWRGHSGVIRSMASIPNKYVISCSEDPIKSFAEMIILWKADEPGVPIHQIDLRQDTLNPVHPLNYFQGGISIHKDKILLGCEMGNALVPIDILCDDDEPSIKIQGFANLGHKAAEKQSLLKGCLVGSGDTAIMNRRGCNEVHIFEISSVSKNPFLDTELIKLDKIAKEKDEKRIEDEDHSTNSMAIGRIIFPDQQSNNNTTSNSTLSSEGPEVLAMNGRWVIAGYKCGSILRSALLPEKFKNETKGLILHASTFHNCSNPNDSQIPHFDTLDHPERPDVQLPIQGLNPGAPQCVIQ